MTDTHRCPDENQIVAMLHGHLNEEAAALLEAHIETCVACTTLIETLAQILPPPALEDDSSKDPSRGSTDQPERYQILGLVGEGGMGAVYRAIDTHLGRHVALKVLRPDVDGELRRAALTTRLQREARLLAGLSHPNVLTIYDAGQWRGQVYISAEFIDGETLAHWLSAGRRSWRATLSLFIQAARGLSAAHDAGLVHRDVKPDNLMVDRQGRVRVMDFGLARSLDDALDGGGGVGEKDGAVSTTRTGDVFGTPAYMSPEQHNGERAGPASDQFSFCASLFEALYDVRPFSGQTREALAEAVCAGRLNTPPWDNHVPFELYAIILKGLETDPLNRHASMQALTAALESTLDLVPSLSPRWWPWVIFVCAPLIFLSGTSFFFAWPFGLSPESSSPPSDPLTSPQCGAQETYSMSIGKCVLQKDCENNSFFVEGHCWQAPLTFSVLASACHAHDILACVELGEALLAEPDRANVALGIDLLRRACDAKSAKGCYALALVFQDGEYAPPDIDRVLSLFELACNDGHTRACNDLGVILTRGEKVEVDLERGWHLLKNACDKGLAIACFNIAGFHASGRGMPQDFERARSLHSDACDWNYAPSCRWLATYFTGEDGREAQLELAAQYWERGCSLSDPASCYHFGRIYRDGLGVEKNMPRAVSAFEDACTFGHVNACFSGSRPLILGEDVAQDRARGLDMLDRGCALKDPKSCYFAGLYHVGNGDPARAIPAYRFACDAGRGDACTGLGRVLGEGLAGATIDLAQANIFFQRACELKDASGCEFAGYFLQTGPLIPNPKER